MITKVNNTRITMLQSNKRLLTSSKKNDSDVFIETSQSKKDLNFKGSKEAMDLFKELKSQHPNKAHIIQDLQSFAENVPYADFPIQIARMAHKVLKGDFTEAGVKSLLYAADNSVFLPVKVAFVSACATKGFAVGSVFPGLGNFIGGAIGGIGSYAAWGKLRNKLGDEIVKLID